MTIQRNWIGRSEGAEVDFRIAELDVDVAVFTTRPDTLFGATFFVLAPEHPLVDEILARSPDAVELRDYVRHAGAKPAEERAAAEEKTGVFTGFYATNPVNDAPIPIWVADYVLMDYGTGAIMAVPAHDERDEAFATTFGLPIVQVIGEDGKLVQSGQFTGLPADEAKQAIVAWLAEQGRGKPAVNYRLRDWSFSRQRYWGARSRSSIARTAAPVAVPDDELPLLLPEVEDYRPKGQPPLASNRGVDARRLPEVRQARRARGRHDGHVRRLRVVLPALRRPARRQGAVRARAVDYWLPVSQYIGGIDHATGHLLYSRFFVKVLNDMGMVGFREPFARLFHQGWVQMGGTKMSKSKGNVDRARRARARVRRRLRAALHPLHGAGRPGHGVDARRHGRHVALRAAPLARRARGVRGAAVERRA